GSPPRAWGQHQVNRVPGASDRFTPTRVGTTAARHSNAPATTVHPHARGDNLVSPRAHPSPFGSPPRAWGQRLKGKWERRHRRFTPTRVGTTYAREVQDGRIPVHPHARGDNRVNRPFFFGPPGSPPRAWGQRGRPNPRWAGVRFTPTRVGTTCDAPAVPAMAKVHPHARGDNAGCSAARSAMAGSPPRAWGQRRWPRSSCRGPRFTPTRVGTTSSNFLSRSAWAVHPHARGDNPPNRAAKGGITVHPHARGDNSRKA